MKLRGLYAITDARLKGQGLPTRVEQAILGGAKLIQYREKQAGFARRYAEARQILSVCRRYQVPLLINDDIQLAAETGADGAHIGQDDAALEQARSLLGKQAIIGVSCYNQFHLAEQAVMQGADYVAFGRFYPSTSKPHAIRADLDVLRYAREQLACPIVAIGGINVGNGRALLNAGADMLAVIQAVFAAPDVRTAAAEVSGLFD